MWRSWKIERQSRPWLASNQFRANWGKRLQQCRCGLPATLTGEWLIFPSFFEIRNWNLNLKSQRCEMKPPPSPCLVVQTILIIIAVFLYKFLPLLERCGNLIGNIVVYQFFHLYQVFFFHDYCSHQTWWGMLSTTRIKGIEFGTPTS